MTEPVLRRLKCPQEQHHAYNVFFSETYIGLCPWRLARPNPFRPRAKATRIIIRVRMPRSSFALDRGALRRQDLDDDVRAVHDVVQTCISNGEDVLVVGHSNAGFTANGALQGVVGEAVSDDVKYRRGRVLGLALTAFIPPAMGKGAFPDVPSLNTSWGIFHDSEPTFVPNDPDNLFYNDLDSEQAAYWTSSIRPMHVPGMPLQFYEAWRHVPISYLICRDDNAMPLAAQEAMIKAARTDGGTVHETVVHSGHSPFLSVPEAVVQWIDRAAREELKS